MSSTRRQFLKYSAASGVALSVPWRGASSQETIQWQFADVLPPQHWSVDDNIQMLKKWDADTKGRLKVTMLPSESSGLKGPDQLNACSENLIQMTQAFGSQVAGQSRILEMLDLPLFVPFDMEFRPKLWDALLDDYAALLEKRFGVYLMGLTMLLPRQLYTKQEVKSVADMKGLKVRAIGPADSTFTRQLGLVATATNFGEVYTTIQQGSNDGIWTTDPGALAMKFYEVAPNVYATNNAGPSVFTIVSMKALKELPEDLQKYVTGQRQEYRDRRLARQVKTAAAIRDILLKRGIKVNEVSKEDQAKMEAAAKPVIEDWTKKLDAEDLKIYEKAAKMIAEYKASKG